MACAQCLSRVRLMATACNLRMYHAEVAPLRARLMCIQYPHVVVDLARLARHSIGFPALTMGHS